MGYLDEYGEKEAVRERKIQRIKRSLAVFAVLLVVAGALFYTFKNYRQEKRVKEFLALLEREEYATAYTLWGCRVEAPCPSYSYKDFLEDWGPQSEIGKLRSYRLRSSQARGSGVEIAVVLNERPEKKLWVEKSSGVLGFAPPF